MASAARLGELTWQTAVLTLSVVVLILTLRGITFQYDFRGDLFMAGSRILHGLSPYQPSVLQHQADVISNGGSISMHPFPRWPMPILVLGAPLALLPVQVAGTIWMILCVASVLLALRLFGVRDSRCVLVALISPPTVIGVVLGNLSPFLLLGAAAAWRLRHHVHASAAAAGAVIVSKVLFWPLGLWMLMTRRRLSVGWTAAVVLVLVTLGWSTIGFADLADYPQMLFNIMRIGEGRGESFTGLLLFCGLPLDVARIGALGCGAALLVLASVLVRRPGRERNAFGLVIVAALIMTPVVWSHYYMLLFVPVALVSPKLSPLWFLPALAAFAPTAAAHSYGLAVLPIFAVQAILVAVLVAPLLREVPALKPVRQWRREIAATARAATPS